MALQLGQVTSSISQSWLAKLGRPRTPSGGLSAIPIRSVATPPNALPWISRGTLRIVLLGDSYTWGYGVPEDGTFASLLARRLPATEVINMGCSGYGTDQELLALEEHGVHFRPDVVIMVVSLPSDFMNNTHAVQYSYPKPYFIIDGDTSTNDTTLIMANGQSGISLDNNKGMASFQPVLDDVLLNLARELVRDAEGGTKVVTIAVRGAGSPEDARTMAETIANSPLVKTAIFGEDANWGRIAAAAGRSGVPLIPGRLDIFFDDVQMTAKGLSCGDRAESAATAVLQQPEFTVTLDLNAGQAEASVLTCDFSVDYVKINADYRS